MLSVKKYSRKAKMNNIADEFDKLKISAFSKSKIVSPHVFDVTIGPNATSIKANDTNDSIDPEQCTKAINNKMSVRTSNSINTEKNALLKKAVLHVDNQRSAQVKEAVTSRLKILQNFTEAQREIFKNKWLKKQQELIDRTERQEQFMLQALAKYDRDATMQHQLLLQHQKQAEARIQRNMEIQAQETKRLHMRNVIDRICKNQITFRNIYQDIVAVMKSCINPQELHKNLAEDKGKLKSLPESMEKILDKCKSGCITDQEYEQSVHLVNEINRLKELISTNSEQMVKDDMVRKAKLENEKTAALEEEKKKSIIAQEEEEKQNLQEQSVAQPIIVKSSNVAPLISKYISLGSLKMYSDLQTYSKNFKNNYQEIVQNAQLKQFRFSLNKSINIPLNAIAYGSPQHLLDKYDRLLKVFHGKTVDVGDTPVNAAQHPQGTAYCKDLLAKQFVLQGDLNMSSKPEAAFSYAAVIVALWVDFPDFGNLVLAHFYQQCPYLIPFYPPKSVDQTDEDYYTSLGYKYVDGMIEQQDKFLKRMTGIMRLYSAVVITKLKRGQAEPHPHGINMGWRWLAAFLNLEPRTDVTATLLFTFLEATGSTLQEIYGRQFSKVMIFIINDYMVKLKKIDTGGPVTRLEVLLQNVQKHGKFEAPKGKLPPNFW